MKRNIILISIVILIAAAFFSCDNLVGLGAKLNLDPPVVTITKPDFMENVGEELIIKGTANDSEEVVFLSISIELVSKSGLNWQQEWKSERGVWRSRSISSDWAMNEGEWIAKGKPGDIEWAITLNMSDAPDGEYLITVGAENNVRNRGAQEQRRVIIDKEGPVTKILLPTLEFEDAENILDYSSHVLPAFDEYELRDPSVLNRLFNQDIRVQYEITDDFSIDTLVIQLMDSAGHVYYNEERKPLSSVTWSGRTEILEAEIDMSASGTEKEKAYLQFITYATDKAGNVKPRNHGWLVYWPESDKPWVTGVGSEHASEVNNNEVYPESDLQFMAYDDDGVKWVSYKIFKWISGAKTGEPLADSGKIYNIPLVEGAVPSGFFSQSFKAPKDFSQYLIEFESEDINGLESGIIERYFSVLDVSAPDIHLVTPNVSESLYGNTSGDIIISGKVSDGFEASKLYVVWLKPGNEGYRLEYQASESVYWDDAPATPGTGVYTDNVGNKIWNITLGANVYDSATNRSYKDFSKTINLFGTGNDNLGISKDVPLTTQTFILRVENATGRALTRAYFPRGDIEQPDLAITQIRLVRGGTEIGSYTPADLSDGQQMQNLEQGDQIFISGTWDDDSFRAWGANASALAHMGDFSVTWNGIPLSGAAIAVNKTWTAGPLTLTTEEAMKGGGRIEATLKDLGNNMAKAIFSARVDTNVPVLMFITSDTPDGSYGSNTDHIDIHFEFNKNVRFTGTASSAYLTLNSGGTAVYADSTLNKDNSGTGNTTHIFRYYMSSVTTDVDVFDVEAITTNNSNWIDENYANPKIQIPQGTSLKNTKKIRIDRTPPQISYVESLSGSASNTNFYNEEKTLYLLLTFNEPIEFTPGSSNLSTLTLNTGGEPGRSPMMMGQNSLLFTYIVKAGDNAATLSATTLSLASGAYVRDLAGNALTTFTIPANQNIVNRGKTITIDTTRPVAPTLTITAEGDQTAADARTINLTTVEVNPKLEYQITLEGNTGPWILFPSSNNDRYSAPGNYSVIARVTDQAGNVSLSSSPQTFTIIPREKLLQSFGGSNPGTYKLGQTIEIRVNLSNTRGAITVTGNTGAQPSIGLTMTPAGRRAVYNSVSGSSLVFRYTIQSGDDVRDVPLEVSDLNLGSATVWGGSSNLNSELSGNWNEKENGVDVKRPLSFYTSIYIRTDVPAVDGTPTLTDTAFTINFTKEVEKGSGEITFVIPDANYRAPAVLTKNEYNSLGGNTVLGSYYKVGTNGTDRNGNPDLSEKYILDYNTDPNSNALKTILIGRNANRVTVAVVSSTVTVSGKTMTVNLTSGNRLPVKGVAYNITVPAAAVIDAQSNSLAAPYTINTLTNPGVNAPFIRVERKKETISSAKTENVTLPAGYGPATIKWVKNARIMFSNERPSEAGNWNAVRPFYINFGGVNNQSTTGAYNSAGNFRIRADSFTTGGQIQGVNLYQQSGTNYLGVGWGTPPGSGWSQIAGGTANWYINLYESIIVQGSFPWNTGVTGIGSSTEGNTGAVVMEQNNRLWVDLDTTGASIQDTQGAGIGWLQVSQSEYFPGGTMVTPIADQPHTANVRIDTQTPNAVIRYINQTVQRAPQGAAPDSGIEFTGTGYPSQPHLVPMTIPESTTGTQGNIFTLGNTAVTDRNGYVYGISAVAYLASGNATSEPSYEKVTRSVIQFEFKTQDEIPNNWQVLRNLAAGSGRALQLWIRGGDAVSGDNSIPGFPLSWNENDYKGIRLMTPTTTAGAAGSLSSNTNVWYWMSWEVVDTAYFYFMAGTTGSDIADIRDNGARDWAWGKNNWAVQQSRYPLYPGGSILFERRTQVQNPATETFEFYNAFSGSRGD